MTAYFYDSGALVGLGVLIVEVLRHTTLGTTPLDE